MTDLNLACHFKRCHYLKDISVIIKRDITAKRSSVVTKNSEMTVVRDNDEDMLVAVKDTEAIKGGFSLVQDGEVLAHLPLPIGGLMTNQTAEEVAEIIEHLIITARDKFNLSHEFHPLMILVFMTLPVIPALKLLHIEWII